MFNNQFSLMTKLSNNRKQISNPPVPNGQVSSKNKNQILKQDKFENFGILK